VKKGGELKFGFGAESSWRLCMICTSRDNQQSGGGKWGFVHVHVYVYMYTVCEYVYTYTCK